MQLIDFIKSKEPGQMNLKKYARRIAYIWSLVIIISTSWDLWSENVVMKTIAENMARTNINKYTAFHFWSASHGGVYVPVTPKTHPNPNLKHLPDSDIIKPDGTKLTLVNAGYMIQQMVNEYPGLFGITGKVTSLNYLSEDNKPDKWEAESLELFEQGTIEAFQYTEQDNQPFLRLMRPMYILKNCLKCHEEQGYKLGDVRGGVEVSVALQPFYSIASQHTMTIIIGRFTIWLLGLLIIGIFSVRESGRLEKRLEIGRVLNESEKKFRSYIQNAPYGIFVTDEEGKYVDINDETEKITGYSRSELLGMNLNELIGSADHSATAQHFLNLKKTGKTRGDLSFIRKNGALHYWTIDAVKLSETRFLGFAEDITERRQIEKTLIESEERFRRLFEDLGDAVFVTKIGGIEQGEIIEVNPSAEKQTGYIKDELIGMNISRDLAVLGTGEISEYEWDEKLLKDGFISTTEKKKRKDGAQYWVEVVVTPVDYKGIKACLSINRDITKRKQSEEDLKILTTAINQSPVSIVITNLQGDIEYVNPKFCELTGYSAKEAFGKNSRILKSGETPKEMYDQLWETITTGKKWRGEFHNKKKNGELYWEDAVISPIKNDNGEITHFIAVKEDITERKQAEEEKARLEKQLRQTQRLETIGTLAGGIAHDFNNILAPIMGFADMAMLALKKNDPLYDDLEQIVKGGYRAKDLIQQILLFSKQSEKERLPLSLHIIVKEALKLIRPSIPTTIQINQMIDESCGKVLADATQIHQVIVNLCTNAWQAMEEKGGKLTIKLTQKKLDVDTVKRHPNFDKTNYACLSIVDTGPGMDEQTMDRIFEPFFTTKAVDKGSGLGLSVVHGIVQSHNGDILVYSEPGKGASFYLYLPIIKSEKGIMETKTENITGGTEYVIVVDDEPVIVDMVKMMLENFGYKVDAFTDGLEVVQAFKQQPDKYDLLVSDLTMPKMTGLDLADQLHKENPDLPVMIMTGFGDSITGPTLEKHCIKQVIGKPILVKELIAAVKEVLD